MKRLILTAAVFFACGSVAHAASVEEIRSAGVRVAQHQKALARAERSGDSVTIATERAALQAAKATAWGRRKSATTPERMARSR